MAKMGLEATIDEIEKGYAYPGTTVQHFVSPAADLKNYGLQKKRGSEATHYLIWGLGVGEQGQQLTYFFGHRLIEAAKKALEWRTGNSQPQVSNGS